MLLSIQALLGGVSQAPRSPDPCPGSLSAFLQGDSFSPAQGVCLFGRRRCCPLSACSGLPAARGFCRAGK